MDGAGLAAGSVRSSVEAKGTTGSPRARDRVRLNGWGLDMACSWDVGPTDARTAVAGTPGPVRLPERVKDSRLDSPDDRHRMAPPPLQYPMDAGAADRPGRTDPRWSDGRAGDGPASPERRGRASSVAVRRRVADGPSDPRRRRPTGGQGGRPGVHRSIPRPGARLDGAGAGAGAGPRIGGRPGRWWTAIGWRLRDGQDTGRVRIPAEQVTGIEAIRLRLGIPREATTAQSLMTWTHEKIIGRSRASVRRVSLVDRVLLDNGFGLRGHPIPI
jgi:hypothetical protein